MEFLLQVVTTVNRSQVVQSAIRVLTFDLHLWQILLTATSELTGKIAPYLVFSLILSSKRGKKETLRQKSRDNDFLYGILMGKVIKGFHAADSILFSKR